MEKNQEDILNMYQTTYDVLLAHAAVYAGNVPFEDAVEELEDDIEKIQNLRDQQEEDITGIAQDKEQKRTTLEERTFTIGSIIKFYASTTGNRQLLKKVNYTRSELTRARDNELPGMSGQVHEEAVANAVAILPYGVTAAMTTGLDDAIGEFTTYISKPSAARTETSAATEQLPPVFDDTNTLLEERIDSGMELYRTSNADFYAQYFNARVIINSPTLKRALEVTFKDSVTNQPIAHVNVLVNGSINRRSSDKGNIRVQSLTEGAHALTASLPGYQNISQNFNVITGETTKLVVAMVKI